MKLPVETIDDVAIVTIPEETLDAGNAQEFKKSVGPALAANDKVVFDLSRLLFVDSSGLGVILSALRTLNSRGGDLKLCGLTQQVRVLFELVRMHRIFEIFDTREEALRAFAVLPLER